MIPTATEWSEGMSLGVEEYGPITREDLRQYGSASGDENPLHMDPEYARRRGLQGPVAHGMLIMAYMSRYWTARISPVYVKRFDTRFSVVTYPGERIFVEGRVRRTERNGTCRRLHLELRARGDDRVLRAGGHLWIEIPESSCSVE